MTRRVAQALLVGCALAILLVLYLAPSVLTVFLGGVALALLLWYPVRWLSQIMPQRFAILTALAMVVVLLALAVLVMVPPLVRELTRLIEELPEIGRDLDARTRDAVDGLERAGLLPQESHQAFGNVQQGLLARAAVAGEGLLTGVLGTAAGAFGVFLQGFGILFIAVYLIADARRLRVMSIRRAPRAYRADVAELWEAVEATLSRYMAGLVIVSTVQGVLVGLALWVLGVPYALVLALWVALTAVIPYLGSWIGGIPMLILAFLTSPLTGVLTFAWFFSVQTVVGNLLTPRVQGTAVRVHPVIVLLGVVAAGSMFGLLGVLFAAPVLGLVRVLLDFLLARLRIRE